MRAKSLDIAPAFEEFIAAEALPGTGVQPEDFWGALESILSDLGPRNAALLARRDELQAQIDDWHRAARADGAGHDADAYAGFLTDIGYLRHLDGPVAATTANVDAEIAEVAGPQLVVPLDNARYALNAANARWGSLYDALYGTDVISEAGGCGQGPAYNPVRGDKVVAAGREFLDTHFTLDSASHRWATDYSVHGGELRVRSGDGTVGALLHGGQFAGYRGAPEAPSSVLLRHNGLHCEICIDRDHPVGRRDHAGVRDIVVESAVTAIMDFEDSVSAVDADDKVAVYRNWLGLMDATLETTFVRDGATVHRKLQPRPQLHRARRLAAHAAGAGPDAGAQRGPPSHHRHGGGSTASRCMRRWSTPWSPRWARSETCEAHGTPRRQPDPQLGRRIGVRRQAQDARTRRGRGGLRAVQPGRGSPRPGAVHPQDGDHGRGAPHVSGSRRMHRPGP